MRSPGSRRALGEYNPITSWRFGESGLTFVSTLETTFCASPRSAFLETCATLFLHRTACVLAVGVYQIGELHALS